MFDKKYEDRLQVWSDFRESLETSDDALQDALDFFSRAPKVSLFTDPWDQSRWPSPWEMIYENQYCEFVRVLGMCYSLQLTERFKGSCFEIHIGIDNENSETYYLLFVDNKVIGYDEDIVDKRNLPNTFVSQRIYQMPSLH